MIGTNTHWQAAAPEKLPTNIDEEDKTGTAASIMADPDFPDPDFPDLNFLS